MDPQTFDPLTQYETRVSYSKRIWQFQILEMKATRNFKSVQFLVTRMIYLLSSIQITLYVTTFVIFKRKVMLWRMMERKIWCALVCFMMTSLNGNIFRVTGHLCGEFPTQRPVTRSFDVFFDLRLNKRLSKQSWGWWFETLSRPLWPHGIVLDPVCQLLEEWSSCLVRYRCHCEVMNPINSLDPGRFEWNFR